jgi:hypothetical protein
MIHFSCKIMGLSYLENTFTNNKQCFKFLIACFLFSAKPSHQNQTSQSPSKGTVPCQDCGSLKIVAFKGGGYNMTSSPQ